MALDSSTLDKLAGIVGKDGVTTDAAALAEYASCNGSTAKGEPSVIVRPKDRKEVQAVIKLANELKLNLIPTSSGGPHFNSGTVPKGEGVIIDVSGMKRIVRVDKLNMVGLIESGVTFSEFEAEAEKQQLRVYRPFQPRQTKSVIASYLEREPMTIPKFHWDTGDPQLTVEVVWGNGEVFRSGSAAGPGTLQQQWDCGLAQKNPEGPAQTSLNRVVQGAQGTLGVVTWSSVKLGMLPQIRRCYVVSSDRMDQMVDFAYRVMRLKFADELLFLDGNALASALGKNADEVAALAEKQAPYNLIYCVCGHWHQPEKRMLYQEKGISEFAQHYGVRLANEVPGAGQKELLNMLDKPSAEPYYKIRKKGGVRELFFHTTLDKAPMFIGMMNELATSQDFPTADIGHYIQPIQQGRNVHLEFQVYCDPSNDANLAAAEALTGKAAKEMIEKGAFFTRPYGAWADLTYSRIPDTTRLLKNIKNIFDPNGVMNRGKLCFEEVG